jgi:hypothetical protein
MILVLVFMMTHWPDLDLLKCTTGERGLSMNPGSPHPKRAEAERGAEEVICVMDRPYR